MFLFIDTETTGLPPYQNNVYPKKLVATKNSAGWEGCRMVQVAWQLFDDSYSLVCERVHIIYPQNDRFPFTIPSAASNIHKITQAHAQTNGTSIEIVLEELERIVQRATLFVAHNVKFDINVLRSEAYRYEFFGLFKKLTDIPKFCTMFAYSGRGRFIKLSDMYTSLVGPLPDTTTLHRADVDVDLCAKIYMKMNPV